MIPKIQPIGLEKYTVEQSKYNNVGKLPLRALLVAPSNSGKTILLQNFILDIYKNCFERVYIFSPSIHVDSTWKPVIQYLKNQEDKKITKNNFYLVIIMNQHYTTLFKLKPN